MRMSNRKLPFDPLREFERLEIIKGELQDRYDAAAGDIENIAIAQLATALPGPGRGSSSHALSTAKRFSAISDLRR